MLSATLNCIPPFRFWSHPNQLNCAEIHQGFFFKYLSLILTFVYMKVIIDFKQVQFYHDVFNENIYQ